MKPKNNVAIIGLGYVGLPTAMACVQAGLEVYGIDANKDKISKLQKGHSYIQDVSDDELKRALERSFYLTTNFSCLQKVSNILICVPTPLKNKIPDLSYVESAAKSISKYLQKGQLVVLESSTYPGTTDELVLSILEKSGLKVGVDFFLAFSPERVDPGNTQFKFNEVPRVLGGVTKKCTKRAYDFYKKFIKKVLPLSSARTAEMTKLLENIYRFVNISLINELTMLADKMDINILEVIEAAKTKPFGFTPFYPSPKIGGHCIPLDPIYLSWKARKFGFETTFIDAAQKINEKMPVFVIEKLAQLLKEKGRKLKGANILLLGAAYKKDLGDTRESAIYPIMEALSNEGATFNYHDPLIPSLIFNKKQLNSVPLTKNNIKNADAVLILTDHSCVDYNMVKRYSQLVFNARYV